VTNQDSPVVRGWLTLWFASDAGSHARHVVIPRPLFYCELFRVCRSHQPGATFAASFIADLPMIPEVWARHHTARSIAFGTRSPACRTVRCCRKSDFATQTVETLRPPDVAKRCDSDRYWSLLSVHLRQRLFSPTVRAPDALPADSRASLTYRAFHNHSVRLANLGARATVAGQPPSQNSSTFRHQTIVRYCLICGTRARTRYCSTNRRLSALGRRRHEGASRNNVVVCNHWTVALESRSS